MRFVFILAWCLLAHVAHAACPMPGDFAPPAARRVAVDLIHELDRPWQAGGRLAVACSRDGWPVAGRLGTEPRNREEEMARRHENWQVARRFNLVRKPGEVKARALPVTPAQEALLERFALSEAGAVWIREVVDDSLRLFNRGDLEMYREVWQQARKSGRMPPFDELVTGRLTEGGLFNQDSALFKIYAIQGEGASAEPGLIALGNAGFRCEFPASSQMVDPHAILSHEFGHTRYGDPGSAGSLLGEASTVERYENPVRVRNGYEPRTVYYLRAPSEELKAQKGSLLSRLIGLKTVEGISIEDRRAIEQIHCECPAPLPVILDCDIRPKDGLGELIESASDQDCRLTWKH